MARLDKARIVVVGIGGVGSWCAEALVRTGIGHITIVDDDIIQASNINRQDPAITMTIGESKVEAMKARLLAINPNCEVISKKERFTDDFATLGECDMIVDAIDSVSAKANLILGATERGKPIISSLGAALRRDPTKIRVKRFDKVEGDGLARALRQRFKKLGRWPSVKFNCVYSEESAIDCQERGSLMQVTTTFGMCLAAEVIREIVQGV